MKRWFVILAVMLSGCIGETYYPMDYPTITPSQTPSVTLTSTLTSTPTQEQMPTAKSTPVVIEVTPLGGVPSWLTPIPKMEDVSGWYTTIGVQNVRYCPRIDCTIRYRLSGGQRVRFVAWVSSLPDEAWLCLTPECDQAVALVYSSQEFGIIEFE